MRDWREAVRTRIRELGFDPDAHSAFIEELAQHLEDRYAAALASGMTPADARAAALTELDGSQRLAAELRVRRLPPPLPLPVASRRSWLASVWQDVKYSARTLRRSPAFTVAAALTIALSTGPTIAALGVANWLFFRPVPGVHDPDRLGHVWFGRWSDGNTSFSPSRPSYAHIDEIRSALTTIDDLAGFQRSTSLNLSFDEGAPRVVEAQSVTANYFDVLGVRMAEGRGFRAEEDRNPGGATVVVLSAALARTLFPGGPAAGRTVRLNNQVFDVIGVAASGFEGTLTGDRPMLWFTGRTIPRLNHTPPERWALGSDSGPFYEFTIRLRPGATFEQADGELHTATARLVQAGRKETAKYETVGPTLYPGIGLDPFARTNMKPFARLLVAVPFVFVLLAAANLVNLFMFRGARRLHEAALRRSLGASAARLVQLHVVEALLVSIAGATLGLAIVAAAQGWLSGLILPGIGILEIAIDWRLFAATVTLAIGIGVLLGTAPARLATRRSLTASLAANARTSTGSGGRFRTGLAVAQLALSLTLLVGGLLFVQTMRNLNGVELGVTIDRVSAYGFSLHAQAYDATRTREFYRQLVERLRLTPGIDAVSASTGLPLQSNSYFRVLTPEVAALEGKSNREIFDLALRSLHNNVSPEYFRVFGMRFLSGRTFSDAEGYTPGVPPGVIISESLALQLFKTAQAAGRLVSFPGQGSVARHEAPVIGVVNDVLWRGPQQPAEYMVYRPFGDLSLNANLTVSSTLPAAEVTRLVREAAATLDSTVPPQFQRSMQQIFDRRVAQQLIFAWVLGILAALGFILAAIGIYGLVSQAVVERVREFGIRLAIGAQRGDVARLVLRQAIVISAIGVPVGLVIAGWSSQFLSAQLFGVTPLAGGIYALATAVLMLAVFVAIIRPTLRAVRVNPVDVMRVD